MFFEKTLHRRNGPSQHKMGLKVTRTNKILFNCGNLHICFYSYVHLKCDYRLAFEKKNFHIQERNQHNYNLISRFLLTLPTFSLCRPFTMEPVDVTVAYYVYCEINPLMARVKK